MTHFKTILMTAALMAVPSVALAQISTDALKDKAVESVLDNMTSDDAIVAGSTLIKGGSKEDAAIAIVKGRADSKIESLTGGVNVDEFSKDGLIDAGKEMAMEKAKDSSTTYTDGVSLGGVSLGDVSADGAVDAGKAIAQDKMIDKAAGSSTTYTGGAVDAGKAIAQDKMIDKAAGSSYVIQKSGSSTTYTGGAVDAGKTITPVNCPSGTKDAGDGTCMITGDWKP